MSNSLGKLHIVATPIGNMLDITLRAIQALTEAGYILCEDTRTTGALLKYHNIPNKNEAGKSKLVSFHAHSKLSKIEFFKELLGQGKNLALVSDAGTPCISDPGTLLISELQKHFEGKLMVSPIPGPSALISALSISGIPAHEFVWRGYVPQKKGRETFFKKVATISSTVIFYESVHRILKPLEALDQYAPERSIFIARELTKLYEEGKRGKAKELLSYFQEFPEKVKGEFVIIVEPKRK